MCISLISLLLFLIISRRLKVPKILDEIKFFGPSMDLSTWVSAARLNIALGLYLLIIFCNFSRDEV